MGISSSRFLLTVEEKGLALNSSLAARRRRGGRKETLQRFHRISGTVKRGASPSLSGQVFDEDGKKHLFRPRRCSEKTKSFEVLSSFLRKKTGETRKGKAQEERLLEIPTRSPLLQLERERIRSVLLDGLLMPAEKGHARKISCSELRGGRNRSRREGRSCPRPKIRARQKKKQTAEEKKGRGGKRFTSVRPALRVPTGTESKRYCALS